MRKYYALWISVLFFLIMALLMLMYRPNSVLWYAKKHRICIEIEDDSYSYQQPFSIGKSVYSSYSQELGSRSLNLMAYAKELEETEGFCMISIHGLDLSGLKFPYTLSGHQGSISWRDVSHHNNKSICKKSQSGCFYLGYGQHEIKITLTAISNGTVSGNFSGKLNHVMVGKPLEHHIQQPIEIVEGYFSMRYE